MTFPHDEFDDEVDPMMETQRLPSVVAQDPPAPAVPAALMPVEIAPAEFRLALEEQREKRQLLEVYIREQLREEVDYGKIGNFGKPTLLKPGAEKIAAVLRLRPTFEQDRESREMLGAEGEGTVCFICRLVTPNGEFAAEGRGACGPEPSRNGDTKPANTRIKIAMKRAQVDAVLRVAALSEQFTQDLEDLPGLDSPTAPSPPSPTSPPPTPSGWSPPATPSLSPAQQRSETVANTHAREDREQRAAPPAPRPPAQEQEHLERGPVSQRSGGPLWQVKGKTDWYKTIHRDGRDVPVQGTYRFGPDEYPEVGGRDKKRGFFAPSEHPKCGFTKEEPWVTWSQLSWRGLFDYAVFHRVKHAMEQGETNRFNDPILAILSDTFWCVYNNQPTWIAEMAVALDGLANAYAAQEMQQTG